MKPRLYYVLAMFKPRSCCRFHWESDAEAHATGKDGVLWNPFGMPFIVCQVCGNKRCPKATDCRQDCTGSNEPGQVGSIYGPPNVRDHRAGPSDPSKAGQTIVAGSGESTCWADAQSAGGMP